jgi:hypothetical protein
MGKTKDSPKLTDPHTEVVALPACIKERLTKLKNKDEPYYSVIERLMNHYEDHGTRRVRKG